LAFSFQPAAFLGIVLGIKTIQDEYWRKRATDWLCWILDESEKISQISEFHHLFYHYIKYHLTGQQIQFDSISVDSSIEELALLEYTLKRNIFQTVNSYETLESVRKNLLLQLVTSELDDMTAEKAALIWATCHESLTQGVNNLFRSVSFVSAILSRFEDAMRRWRYDQDTSKKKQDDAKKPKDLVRWPINEEREVQDVLWLILCSYFDDLIDEESLPKFGHSFYKPDFAIPTLKLLIEAKVAYKKDDFKKIEKGIMEDSIGYLINTQNYDKILVFIYDKSVNVQEHNTTKSALMQIPQIQDVVIVSKPSMLP
jgi:hypothetical protein